MATDKKKQAAKSAGYKSEMILIGTYKGKQLDTWPGLYNYPLRADSIGECIRAVLGGALNNEAESVTIDAVNPTEMRLKP